MRRSSAIESITAQDYEGMTYLPYLLYDDEVFEVVFAGVMQARDSNQASYQLLLRNNLTDAFALMKMIRRRGSDLIEPHLLSGFSGGGLSLAGITSELNRLRT